jgi:hypothetical protein
MIFNKTQKRKKLFVHMQGRLGNQLFIYFAAKFFEEYHQKKIIFISDKSNRLHEIGIKNNCRELVLPEIILGVISLVLSQISKIKLFGRHIHFSKEVGYEDLSKRIDKIKYINGYFQTFHYAEESNSAHQQIQEVRHFLHRKFGYGPKIVGKNALAIHIRRGDYLLPKNSFFGVISENYYVNSVREMLSMHQIKEIYMFSDSPISRTLENEIKIIFPSLTLKHTDNLSSDIETLALLTCFRYHIVSNSTYSWWGTFLSATNDKVIAPRYWFKDRPAPNKLIPSSWDRAQNAWD